MGGIPGRRVGFLVMLWLMFDLCVRVENVFISFESCGLGWGGGG